jgi:hypothetical protein
VQTENDPSSPPFLKQHLSQTLTQLAVSGNFKDRFNALPDEIRKTIRRLIVNILAMPKIHD